MLNASSTLNTFRFSVEILSTCSEEIAFHVSMFAKTGTLYFFEKVPIPLVWSECSCVTKIPQMLSGVTDIESSACSIFLTLTPASIRIFVLGPCANKQLPVLLLYKLQK